MLILLSLFSATVGAQIPATDTPDRTQMAKEVVFSSEGSTFYASVERNNKRYPIAQIPKLHVGDALIIDLPANVGKQIAFVGVAFIPRPGEEVLQEFKQVVDGSKTNLSFSVKDPDSKILIFLAPAQGNFFSSKTTLEKAVIENSESMRSSAKSLSVASNTATGIDQYLNNILSAQPAGNREEAIQQIGKNFGYTVSSKCVTESGVNRKCITTDFMINANLKSAPNNGNAVFNTFLTFLSPEALATAQLGAAFIKLFTMPSAEYEYLYSVGYLSSERGSNSSRVDLMLPKTPTLSGSKLSVQIWSPTFEENETAPALAFKSDAICLAGDFQLSEKTDASKILVKPYGTEWKLTLYSDRDKTIGEYDLVPNPLKKSFGVKDIDRILPQLASWSGKRVRGAVSYKWAGQNVTPLPLPIAIPDTAAKISASLMPVAAVAGEDLALTFDTAAAPCIQSVAIDSDPQAAKAKIETSVDQAVAIFKGSSLTPGDKTLILNVAGYSTSGTIPLKVTPAAPIIKSIVAYSGDSQITVQGMGLDRIASLTIDNLVFTPVATTWASSGSGPDTTQNIQLTAPDGLGAPGAKSAVLAFTDNNPAKKTISIAVREPRPVAQVSKKYVYARLDDWKNWDIWDWTKPQSLILPISAVATVELSVAPPTTAFSGDTLVVIQRADGSGQIVLIPDSYPDSKRKLRVQIKLPPKIQEAFNGDGTYSYFVRDKGVDGNPRELPFTFVRLPIVDSSVACAESGSYDVTVSDRSLIYSIGPSAREESLSFDPCSDSDKCLKVQGPLDKLLYSKIVDASNIIPIKVSVPSCSARAQSM